MKTVVQFGAGGIGRGFLGQIWTEAGYEVVFVDVDMALVDALNRDRAYTLRLVDNEGQREKAIGPVRALPLGDGEAVAAELARCEFGATAVGVSHYLSLAPLFATGLRRRENQPALNILLCENDEAAAQGLAGAITALPERFACVQTAVGRMVPTLPPELRAQNPTLAVAERGGELWADSTAWRGPKPDVAGLLWKENFGAYLLRKLVTHNAGHAAVAYHGFGRGYTTIAEAMSDPHISRELEGVWSETGAALVEAFGFSPDEQREYESDLRRRFRNRFLSDTVVRVGGDPARKLRPGDRLVRAALLCSQHGIQPVFIARAIAAALRFDAPSDPSAPHVQALLRKGGVKHALTVLSGLAPDSLLARLVETAYNEKAV